ncbi:hypothetical protein TYRP_023701 [Tyrophagus putrescentiae]|nr:hypothetical protein TYRP_023701 [Tyrophagus putrescentiae]
MDNFLPIYDSVTTITNKQFREGPKAQLRFAQAAPLEKDDESDRSHPRSTVRNSDNIHAYRAYAIVTATMEVKAIVDEKLSKTTGDHQTLEITAKEAIIIKSNICYFGSGQQKRPSEHLIAVNDILSGRFAPIWTHTSQTMNAAVGDFARFGYKLCIHKEYPRKYLRNHLSRKALQFVSDYGIETVLRNIGGVGKTSQLYKLEAPGILTKNKADTMPCIQSALHWVVQKKTDLGEPLPYYRFGNDLFDEGDLNSSTRSLFLLISLISSFRKKYDKERLANDMEFLLKTKLASFPSLLDAVKTGANRKNNRPQVPILWKITRF